MASKYHYHCCTRHCCTLRVRLRRNAMEMIPADVTYMWQHFNVHIHTVNVCEFTV